LNSNVTYNVAITSVYISGNTFPVENKNAFYTLNEGPPIDINIQYIKGTSILFSFANAIGNPSKYELVLTNTLTNQNQSQTIDVNNTQNILVGNLKPNVTYNFLLKSNYSQTNNIYTYNTTFKTLNEGIVQNFVINSVGNSFVTFSFTYPPGDNYNITVIMNNALDYKTVNINTNQYTMTGLLIGYSYTLSINTVYTKSNTTYTYLYPDSINTLFEGPSIINNVNNITDQTVYIEFSNSYNKPDKYVFVNTNVNIPTNKIITEYLVSNSNNRYTSIVITGLLPNSKYITVLNTYYNLNTPSQNVYPNSSPIEINTKGSPTNIQVGEFITDIRASITFVAPIVEPTKYILSTNYNTTLDISINQITTVGNQSYYEINNKLLSANNYYDMSLSAYYKDINQSYTNSFSLTTKGPVQNIYVNTITDTSATLVFNPPLVIYDWVYNVYIHDRYTNINYSNSTNTSFVFEDLSKNTSYTVYIEAVYNTNKTTQTFLNNITFNTKSFPYGLSISNILDTQLTLNWTNVLNTPTYYNITYAGLTTQRSLEIDTNLNFSNIQEVDIQTQISSYDFIYEPTYQRVLENYNGNTLTVYPSEITTDIQTQTNSYNIFGLIPDISYTIFEISAYYSDINTAYTNINVDLSAVFTKSPPTDISGYNQTDVSMTISFITPLNTKPTSYSISAVDTSNNIHTDFSLNTGIDYEKGTVITYDISGLSNNTNYNIFANSHYTDSIIKSSGYNISTHGTPNILSFTSIYKDSFTINIQPLFIQPLNCIFTFYNIRLKQTTTIVGQFNTNGKYTTPSIFLQNDTYNVTIQSVYSNNEKYTSITKQVSTSSAPILLSYVSTDVSAIVYFIPPLNPPNSYNYTTSNTVNPVTVDTFTNYFIINDLSATSINNITLYSYYSDNNQNYGSDSIKIYTKGPPSNLIINTNDVFNTYINISFTTAYECSKYTINAIDTTGRNVFQTSTQSPSKTLNTVNFTLNGLSEDTGYNIFVTSNYDNFNGNSSQVQIHTYKAIQIERITNITDVSAIIIVNTRPSILPTDISFSYTAGNINYVMDVSNVYNSSTDSSYYIFKIDGLTPNTKYDPFTINSYYIQDNVTFVSENKPFSTKGVTNISMYVTDISATISFPRPYITPSNYYYVLDNANRVVFTPTAKINDNIYTISNLPENTPYSHFTIQTEYSDISGTYISQQDLSFCTKIIPSPIFVVGDTQIDISFTKVKSPFVKEYSYSLDPYTYDFVDVSFIPVNVDVNGVISLTISGLTPNTFYNFFKINVEYSDINEKYSSKNNAFNTMGSPTGAILSTPTVDNYVATLSFYPPLYPPTNYIITNPNNNPRSYIIYASDISYINNVYSCQISNVQSVKDIKLASYYKTLDKTIQVDILTILLILPDSTIRSIQTDDTGQYIAVSQNTNNINKYSSDYGKTWSTTAFSNTIQTNNNNTSTDNIIVITKDVDGLGLYFSNDGSKTSNYLLSSYVEGLQNTIISGNGRYVYAYTATNIYSYTIPVEKGSAYNLSFQNIKDKSIFFSFYQPSFIPDLSYDIIVTNHYISSEVHVYKSSISQNLILDGLTPNALYDISLNTNYSKEIQTFSTGLTSAFNMKSAPVNLKIVGNPTDASAIIQFIEPILKPMYYILKINDISYSVAHTDLSKTNVKGIDIGYYLQPNDISLNTYTIQNNKLYKNIYYLVTLSSFYDNNNNNTFVSNDVSFNTRGYPSIPVFTNIYDTSVNLSFTLPKNTNDISGYTIEFTNTNTRINSIYITKTNNTIINELSANSIYSIRLSTTYKNPLQTLTSIDYQNALYTKGGPLIDVSYLSITDSSAIIQINTRPLSIIQNNNLFLKYQLGIDNSYKETKIYSTNDISYIIVTGLPQNTNKSITLKTFYTDTSSTFLSNSVSVPTQGYPANIRSDYNYITNINANIRFDPAYNPPPKGYNVKIYSYPDSLPDDPTLFESNGKLDTSYNFTFDITQEIYYVYVGSKYTDTKILYSNKISFYMARSPTDVSLIPTSITDTSANISFKPPNLAPLKYTITVKRPDTSLITNVYDISSTSSINTIKYTLTNLPKNTNLSITYTSVYPSIKLDAAQILTFATVGPPRNINIVNNSITNSSAAFTFSPPLNTNTNISYMANLKNITNNTTRILTNINTAPNINILQDLSSNSTYELYLQAKYANGVVSNSKTIGFNTQGIVSSVRMNNITDTQNTVSYALSPSTPTSYNLTVSGEVVGINRTYLNITNPYTVIDLSKNSIYHSKIFSNYDSNWNVLF
jgi:hypothetical protein